MSFHGYELIGDWKNSNCGKTALANKGGKKYFLKKYQTVVAPIDNGTMDARTIAHNQALFDAFVNRRKEVNSRIRTIAGAGGNIIIPCEEFIDGNQLVEASEFVEGGVDREDMAEVLSKRSFAEKKLLMMTAAGALGSVHSKGIIHSDLKLPNVLLVKNSSNNYVAKLIDFDGSYPDDDKPDEMIGTPDFYSPELGKYICSEEYTEENKRTITYKTDIFSLGLIYHFYLTGEYPEPICLTEKLQARKDKGKVLYPYVVLNNGCKLQVSSKITDPNLVALIEDMLSVEPENRPTANEVLMRLKNPGASTSTTSGGTTTSGTTRGTVPPPPPPAAGFEEPSADLGIELDLDKIKSKGFVSGKNDTVSGIKGYRLFTAEGKTQFMNSANLLLMKYAKKKSAASAPTASTATTASTPAPSGFAEPWPEHNIVFDEAALRAKDYVGSERKTMSGVNGYELVRTGGARQFLRVEMLVMLKMAKRI